MLPLAMEKRYGGDVLNVDMNGRLPCIAELKVTHVLNVEKRNEDKKYNFF